jgi:hypothetical protein
MRARTWILAAALGVSATVAGACFLSDVSQEGKPCQTASDCVAPFVCNTYQGANVCHSVTCDAEQTYCAGEVCTDTQSDPANCGACGNDCLQQGSEEFSLESCVAGECTTFCTGSGFAYEPGGCTKEMVYFCGGVSCPATFECASRNNVLECLCNSEHAGACGAAGTCEKDSDGGLGVCSCGGSSCRPGELCAGQRCHCAGPCEDAGPDAVCCGDAGCKDLSNDRENCGVCGLTCPAPAACLDGVCQCSGDPYCMVGVTQGVSCLPSGLCKCPTTDGGVAICASGQRCTTAGCR